MEDKNRSEVRISISEGKFEIKGSEEFVSKQVENFKELIEKSISDQKKKTKELKTIDNELSSPKPIVNESNQQNDELGIEEKYPDIYTIDGENVIIVADIPGNSSAAQTLNAAILYAFAQLQMGNEETKVEEIRKICESHGFLDTANFSSHIRKGDPKLYLDKGKSKDRSIKLTRPGTKRAEEIISTIIENE